MEPDHILGEYKKSLRINPMDLDNEVVKQPELYWHISDAYADTISNRDHSKIDLDLIEADATFEIRAEYEENGTRCTDKLVEAELSRHDSVRKARMMYADLKMRSVKVGGMKEAFQQRASMLKELTSLYTSQYFTRDATMSAESNNKEMRVERAKTMRGKDGKVTKELDKLKKRRKKKLEE